SALLTAFRSRATPSTTPAAATTTTKRRIGFRIHQEPIEKEIDRLSHHFDRVECRIVEGVIGTLDESQCGRHAERVELRVKVDARLCGNRPVICAVDEDRRREALRDVRRGRCGRDVLWCRLSLREEPGRGLRACEWVDADA